MRCDIRQATEAVAEPVLVGMVTSRSSWWVVFANAMSRTPGLPVGLETFIQCPVPAELSAKPSAEAIRPSGPRSRPGRRPSGRSVGRRARHDAISAGSHRSLAPPCWLHQWRHCSGRRLSAVVSALALINVVNEHWARLVLGWVTVCGRVNHLGM